MKLLDALADLRRKDPAAPALRDGREALDRDALAARIDGRAEELSKTAPEIVPLDASDPTGAAIDFFAARAVGRTAVAHARAIPHALREEREARLRGLLPPLSDETVFYSSGSVAAGKAVPLSEDRLLFAAFAFPERTGIGAADRVAVGVSVGQIFGFLRGVLNALLVGAETLFYSPRRDPIGEAAALGATFLLLSAEQVRLAAASNAPARLRGVLSGGAPMADAFADAIESRRHVPVRLGYGLTESTGLGTRQHLDRPRRAGSAGLPAPGVGIDAVAPDGTALGPRETGEIRMSGPAIFRGYADPREPAPFDETGRLRTGDLGFRDEEGELHVRGRAASSIVSRGRILCAEELEKVVLEQPGVSDVAAVPIGDAFGLLLVGGDASERFLESMRESLSRRLPAFARPRRLRRVEAIPRAPSGKVDRVAALRCFESP